MMYMNIFIYESLTGLTIYQRSADVLSGWTFCQDRLRHFVRKTFCQDRLRCFVRTDRAKMAQKFVYLWVKE